MTQQIDANLFTKMVRAGAERLNTQAERVNALNVFPVPDGDTGTNMNLTLTSGAKELERKAASSSHVGELAEALSKGLLMGARGNSGVILSQLFRGFGKGVADKETLTARTFAEGLKRGVETAYKAVIKPVEGTVLTVAREAADKGTGRARKSDDVIQVMEAVLQEARRSLDKTPQLLPVLAEAGVVDAGGQGLVTIYEGFLGALTGKEAALPAAEEKPAVPTLDTIGELAHQKSAQSHFDTTGIEHGYCTEFIVRLDAGQSSGAVFSEEQFRTDMGRFGDSLLVVADDDLVKVHIHAEHPGDTLTYAQRYGALTRIKIDNMREQHTAILEQEAGGQVQSGVEEAPAPEKKPFGFVAVAAGDGIADIFKSLGVDAVIQGGQTMNPSTEEILNTIQGIRAQHIFVLPNNKNIILTAEQVTEWVKTPVTVLPTRTIPQGLAALLSFNAEDGAEENRSRMMDSVRSVRSGEVTYAVRDSQYEGGEIKEGDFLGIREGKIRAVGGDLLGTSRDLLADMLAEGADVVTVLYGKDATDDQVKEVIDYLEEHHPDVECEVHDGGQPLYFFLFAVE